MNDVMEAVDIDEEGNWVDDDIKVPLVGAVIPIPSDVAKAIGGKEEQEIIMMVEASHYISQCPSCQATLPENTIILITESLSAKMMPVHCCNTIVWMKNKVGEGNYGTQS